MCAELIELMRKNFELTAHSVGVVQSTTNNQPKFVPMIALPSVQLINGPNWHSRRTPTSRNCAYDIRKWLPLSCTTLTGKVRDERKEADC